MVRTSPKTGRMTAADWIILAGAGTYLAWTVTPNWYRAGGGKAFGIPLPSYTFNAWRGTTMFAALAAILAIAWLGLRLGGVRIGGAVEPKVIDLILGAAGLLLTILGLVLRPTTGLGEASASWALPVAIVFALLWAFGALWTYRERRSSRSSSAVDGSGFTSRARP
ncbi:MAG TPA: hypothetical protein VE915_02200 [Actinomycetota bacterium]|nr:hypothetical protein [Actinomycetota bacterium]